jgi:hypothetical protein
METITHIPARLIGNHYYIDCQNRSRGWGKMHKGHTVKKCKVGCDKYRGFTPDHQLLCAWSPKITVDPISTDLKGGDNR